MPDYENEIRQLVNKLNYYTKLYDEGRPEISDEEWDNMYFELMALENETGIYFEDSPTQRVNYQVVNKLNKVEHSHPMLSLDKTKDIDSVVSFLGNKEYIVMCKMDGLTCSLTYEDGRLTKAETRGNGIIGEDILHNALQVKNIPKKINSNSRYVVVDGEIICDYNSFQKFKDEYKNPRNFASGSIRLLDSKESAMRNLSFIAWDCIEETTEKTLSYKLMVLKDLWGFCTVPYFFTKEKATKELIEKDIEDMKVMAEINNYPIDGVVFKFNNIAEYEAAGRTDHHFKGGLAFKFYDEEYETTLKNVEYTMGRTGQLTPVAIFEPIDIDGTEVSRASLHNISILKETLHGYGWAGQKVSVFKANQIIPQISRAQEENELTKLYFHYPMTCPICGGQTEIIKENSSEVLYCSNPNCEGKALNKFAHFCDKKCLDIKGLSKMTIEKLLDWEWLTDFHSIYELKNYRDEWIKKAGFGVASVDKILNAIEESRNTTFAHILAAAGIPLLGSTLSKKLEAIYSGSWVAFREDVESKYDFSKLPDIGETMCYNILHFNYDEIDRVVDLDLNIQQPAAASGENSFEGKTFCITGKTHIFKNRAELTADIESKGGRVVSSMSSKVDYLVNNDNTSTSAKNKAAQSAGIPILTEEEYLEL